MKKNPFINCLRAFEYQFITCWMNVGDILSKNK